LSRNVDNISGSEHSKSSFSQYLSFALGFDKTWHDKDWLNLLAHRFSEHYLWSWNQRLCYLDCFVAKSLWLNVDGPHLKVHFIGYSSRWQSLLE